MKEILSSVYSFKLKNIISFLNQGLIFIFFSNGHIHNVVKIYVENGVVSTLPNVVQINVVQFDVVQRCNFNVDVHNVISTLIWRCVTSRCHINPKTTLKRRWNVCWVMIHPEVPIGCPKKDFEFSEANRLFFIRIKTKIDEAQYSYYFKVLSLKMFLFRSYFVRNLLMLLGYVYSWGAESYIIR